MVKVSTKKQRKPVEPVEALWPDDGMTMEMLSDRLGWARVYWTIGPSPRSAVYPNDVKDPPNAGWSHAFVLPSGGRRVRLFCPFTFQGYDVGEKSAEYNSLTMPRKPLRAGWMAETMLENWKANERYGFQRDYDTATRVFMAMGLDVPMRVEKPVEVGAEPKKRKGKPAGPTLLKPVARDSRRGRVLDWFMDSMEPRSVREAMAEFDTTRSNILTVFFQLNKDHGIGYTLSGDAAELELPKAGCKQLFC